MRPWPTSWAGPALFCVGLAAGVDRCHRRVAPRDLTLPAEGRGAVVVLGLPGTNPALRAVQRWRVGLALEVWGTGRCDRVVFTGGPTRGEPSEAREMAALAVGRGLDPAAVVLDERSRSTRENVAEAARLLGPVDFVVLASDALHAARARRHWQARPDAPRLLIADRYRPGDHLWLRVPVTVFELAHACAVRLGRVDQCPPQAEGRP